MSRKLAIHSAAAVALLIGVGASAQQPKPAPRPMLDASGVRAELERFEGLLEVTVQKISRPAPIPVVGIVGGSRGYLMPGFGAVFVLPARALPSERRVIVMRGNTLRDAQKARRDLEREIAAAERGIDLQARTLDRQAIDREIQQVEVLAEAYQRDAERASQEADRALARVAQEIRQRFPESDETLAFAVPVPPPPAASAPSAPAAPAAPAAPTPPLAPAVAEAPPAPPWRFWFQSEDDEPEPRPAGQIVLEVRGAITQALEAHGASLRIVRPEEVIVVAVDFTRGGFLIRQGRSSADKTLVVRARKQDLDERVAGRMSPDELRKRISYTEY